MSEASIAKRRNNHEGHGRITDLLVPHKLIAASQMERYLSGDVKWLGVVHADGNGFGAMLHRLDEMPHTRTFQRWYADTSSELQRCGVQALSDATARLHSLHGGGELPLIPLIASGDDLTVLVDGRFALPFTAAYLHAFERHTRESLVLREVALKLTGRQELTTSAGVALVKPHFPFSVAYRLAGQACTSAKRLSRLALAHGERGVPVSALDWHVHYDSIGTDLRELRAMQRTVDGRSLLRRPYAIDPPSVVEPVTRGRSWARLADLVEDLPVLRHPDPGEALPATQLFRLRRVLREDGGSAADRLFRVLCRRSELAGLRRLGSQGDGDPSSGHLGDGRSGSGDPGGGGSGDGGSGSGGLFETVPRLDSTAEGTEESTLLFDFLDAREFFGRDNDDTAEPWESTASAGPVPSGGMR